MTSRSNADFDGQEVLAFAIELAKKAGNAILQGSRNRKAKAEADWESLTKKNTADLVTETDQAVEKLVKETIAAKYPRHKFIGEESWAAGEEAKLDDAPTWIVDPIDGTTNFVTGFPFCAISIGVAYKQRPVIGVVYNPFLRRLYSAWKGNGAHLEYLDEKGTQIGQPSKLPLNPIFPLPSLRHAVVAVEWGSDRTKETIEKKTLSFARLCGNPEEGVQGGQFVRGVRSIGSAALSCCAVAEGALDLWQEVGCWAWDVCAGAVIAQEAGGAVVGSKQAFLSGASKFNDVTPEVLQGRKYVVIRAIADSEGEKGIDAQKRIITDFYGALEDWEAK
ncbi:Inositol monophosphatase [Ceraceosorus bombacis]|uniref:Inositol-1-monophosphatase n=1 Tax=Ceraceosorus bombacis TaxID=401625 RepID=A0A0P1BFN8_9BASI|nr:Inositol monophosphatase [Ceraceosorus bombacis]